MEVEKPPGRGKWSSNRPFSASMIFSGSVQLINLRSASTSVALTLNELVKDTVTY